MDGVPSMNWDTFFFSFHGVSYSRADGISKENTGRRPTMYAFPSLDAF